MDRRQVAYLIASTVLIGMWVALRSSVWPLVLLLLLLFITLFSWTRGR